MKTITQTLTGTTEEWERTNPVLLKGLLGIEVRTDGKRRLKIGNGKLSWKDPALKALGTEDIEGLRNELDNLKNQSGKGQQDIIEIEQALQELEELHSEEIKNVTALIETEAQERRQEDDALLEKINTEANDRSNDVNVLNLRIDAIKNMGAYVGGFDTYALLPKNKSWFPDGIDINCFAFIKEDETRGGASTRYIVSAIKPNGDITWLNDDTMTFDLTEKADKVKGVAAGNLAELDASGNLADSGKKASDFASAGAVLVETENTDADMSTPAVQSTLLSVLQTVWKKIRSVVNAFTAHTGDEDNPHNVTKSQVGLENVTDDEQVKRSELPLSLENGGTGRADANRWDRGQAGLVPAPGGSGASRYLREDGSWAAPPDTTMQVAMTSTTNLPVGSFILIVKTNASSGDFIAINANITPRLNGGVYDTTQGTLLTGSWRVFGTSKYGCYTVDGFISGVFFILARRVS